MRPFEGVKILDFTWVGVGPLSINYLNYYGATAIKVESAIRPDSFRYATPYKEGKIGPETSYGFHHAHPTKAMCVTLNRALDYEAKCFASVANSEDLMEGMRAFAEKRKPVFKGR